MLRNIFRDALHHFVVGEQQIVAAHARLARQTGGDHHHIGVRRRLIIVSAGDRHIVAFDGPHLEHVQALALRHAFHHVDQNHIAQFFHGEINGAARANISSAHYGDFIAHKPPIIA